jgi:hypothetical protein
VYNLIYLINSYFTVKSILLVSFYPGGFETTGLLTAAFKTWSMAGSKRGGFIQKNNSV